MTKLLIYGHRGFSGQYPENTMTAFKKVLNTGADGIELDVQLTRDGEVVIIHDETVDRTTDGTGFVRDFFLKDLQALNAAKVRPENCPEETIPTFETYCQWVKDTDLITNIEIKSSVYYYQDLEDRTLALVKKYHLEDRVIFSSFNPLSLVKLKRLSPEMPCGLLTENGGIDNAGPLCRDFGFEYYHPCKDDLTEENLAGCSACGVSLNVWTVNDFESLSRLRDASVTGIITNHPDMAAKILKNR